MKHGKIHVGGGGGFGKKPDFLLISFSVPFPQFFFQILFLRGVSSKCMFSKCIFVFENFYLVFPAGCGHLKSLDAHLFLINKLKCCAAVHFFPKFQSSVTVDSMDSGQNDKLEVTLDQLLYFFDQTGQFFESLQ